MANIKSYCAVIYLITMNKFKQDLKHNIPMFQT